MFFHKSVLFLLAGFETTGTSLTNVIFMLTKHPERSKKTFAQPSKKNLKNPDTNKFDITIIYKFRSNRILL